MIRVLFAGSPEAAAKTFEIIREKAFECEFEIVGVLTNPPAAKGRHKELVPTPVGIAARNAALPVFEPEHLDGEARKAVSVLNPDILVCFAYGHIFGPKFMGLFKFGGINLHPSSLPEFRGCTPVNAAILGACKKTSFTIQKVSEKMDEGNILAQLPIELNGTETAPELLMDAALKGADLICNILKEISSKGFVPDGSTQAGEASYTGMITREMAKIDWSRSAKEIDCAIRGYAGDPGAWTIEPLSSGNSGKKAGSVLKILRAYGCDLNGSAVFEANESIFNGAKNTVAELKNYLTAECGTVCVFEKSRGIFVKCGDGFICITELQRQGKNAMKYKDFMNGARNFIGTVFDKSDFGTPR